MDSQPIAIPTLTKIVATIGPTSNSPEMVRRLITAGVNVFRLNFSHGTLPQHAENLARIRAAASELGQPVAVMGDLQGPKLRVGVVAPEGLELKPGEDVAFTPSEQDPLASAMPATRLPTPYPHLARDVLPGERVLINDGLIRLIAIPRETGDAQSVLRCRVMVGGLVTSKKGINLPDSDVQASAITDQDWECVEWAVAHGLDFLALSFVRRADEVLALKSALAGMCPLDWADTMSRSSESKGSFIRVIAKIEKPQALADLDAIVQAADAIMVARGDLGVEMDVAQVPVIQRQLITKCDEWGKPCIVATQMLESMVTSAIPTRAEAGDVATAVFSGADAVMLSAESAMGKHPVLVVETMRRIVAAAEAALSTELSPPTPALRLLASRHRTAALAHGAFHVARDFGARLIVCWSQEGGTARYLSQTGLHIPIVAYTNDPRQVRRMALYRGVTPRLMSVPADGSLGAWNVAIERDLIALGWISTGDALVLLAGRPLGTKGATTALSVHIVGDGSTGFMHV